MSTNILVATSNVKFYTGITTTGNDALIESMIPIVQSDIVNYTNNEFIRSTMYIYEDTLSFSTSTGFNTLFLSSTDEDFSEFFTSTTRMLITNSKFNDGYYSLYAVGTTYVQFNEAISTESSSTGKFLALFRVDYPSDLSFIASRMIKYNLDNQANPGIESERIGDYSYKYTAVGSGMYPVSIANGLTKYRKMRSY